MSGSIFPFSAIVGQSDFKLALILNLIEPALGGVLAIGDKGTGKTTLIRSLASLVSKNQQYPFVNLPIGASEDRVLGHVNLETLINDKKEQLQEGLLSKAHQGCLYIDEINLLNDYLMDILLDASMSGSYYLEREGFSKKIDSRFCLIGSMNPEEGDLRPQLKDRFGLSVGIKTVQDIQERQKIIEYRMAFDDNPDAFNSSFEEEQTNLLTQIEQAKTQLPKLKLAPTLYSTASALAIEHQVEGHRADILLIKTARAYAAFLGDTEVLDTHIHAISHLVLNHRSNRNPQQNQNHQNHQSPESNPESNPNHTEEKSNKDDGEEGRNEHTFNALRSENTRVKSSVKAVSNHNKGKDKGQSTSANRNALDYTSLKSVDTRKTVGQYVATSKFELKHKFQNSQTQRHLMFIIDSSGSMVKDQMAAYAKGLVEKYSRSEQPYKTQFSLVTLYNGDAQILCSGVSQSETLIQSLETLKTGGKTNIIAAFKAIKQLTSPLSQSTHELTIVTDGKFNYDNNQDLDQVVLAYKTYCKSIQQTTVIDTEHGLVRLEQAHLFASKINAKYEPLIPVK